MITTSSSSILPTTDQTIRDLLPEIELTPRVVEALADDNWRLGADEPPALAEVAATARMLVVCDRADDAQWLAEIRAAWASWDAAQQAERAAANVVEAVAS